MSYKQLDFVNTGDKKTITDKIGVFNFIKSVLNTPKQLVGIMNLSYNI